jgi:hypothetical protein
MCAWLKYRKAFHSHTISRCYHEVIGSHNPDVMQSLVKLPCNVWCSELQPKKMKSLTFFSLGATPSALS